MLSQIVQSILSLIAIFALARFAKILGLGGEARIRDTDHAKQIAFDSIYGFSGSDAVVDRAGYGALVKDAAGRHVLIRAQGVHFVTRMITPPIEGRLDQKFLTIALNEPDFAPVTLNLGDDAQFWAAGLRHIPRG
jgi:hypothetical protein